MDVDSEDDEEGDFEQKMANLRRRIKPADCLFCTRHSETVDENVGHMSSIHSFFIPDREILIDLAGLLSYLGEKVAVGNLCIFCPNGGKEFGSLEAVRKHMIDKNHCKLAYETDEDRAELADFYDFQGDDDEEDWEDEDGEEVGSDEEVTDASDRPQRPKKASVALAADGLSLVLPSGRTLGHRSLKVYYDQRYRPSDDTDVDQSALKVALVRKKLADPSLALVPVAGGHGAFGRGQQLMKARNAGEAKWAKKQGRNFQDQSKREQFKTKVGYIHNSQKRELLFEMYGQMLTFFISSFLDFRDPLCKFSFARKTLSDTDTLFSAIIFFFIFISKYIYNQMLQKVGEILRRASIGKTSCRLCMYKLLSDL